MGKLINKGWQKSVKDAPSPISIIFGANLAPSTKPKAELPKDDAKPIKRRPATESS